MGHLATVPSFVRRWLSRVRRVELLALALLAGAAGVATAVYLTAMGHYAEGQLAAPIDDAYIHYQYARHMAAGHWYEYNPGDGVSTGATSLLWTPLVALGYLIGFRDQSIIAWAVGLNVLCLVGYGVLLYRLGVHLLHSRPLAALIATAIMLEGRVLWGFFAGTEIGLYHLVLLAVVYFMAQDLRLGQTRHRRLWIGACCLLPLVRPEGSFLAGFAVVVYSTARWLEQRQRSRQRPGWRWWWREERAVGLPLLVWLAQWAALYAVTGQATPNGLRVKSHLYEPDQTLAGVVIPSLKFYQDMLLRHFPWLFERSLGIVLALLFFAGAFAGCAREWVRRRPGPCCLMVLWFFGGLAVQSLVLNAAYHHGRYQMNYTFIFWLLLVVGIRALLAQLRLPSKLARAVLGGVGGLLLVMMLNSVVIFSQHFGKDCRAIQRQHVAMGKLVARLTPPDAAVGINDAGAIAYVSGRYVYDVFGLTTNIASRWRHDGQACLFEQMAYLDPTTPPRRPGFLAIYPEWYPAVVHLGMLTELARVEIPEPNICGSSTKALFAVDWSPLERKEVPVAFRRTFSAEVATIVDALDVAYRPDEIAHGYRHWRHGHVSEWGSDLLRLQPYVDGDGNSRIVDGGRELAEREELTVRGVVPHRPLLVVRRTDGLQSSAQVHVDGRDAGRWQATRGPAHEYRDEVFQLSAGHVTAPTLTIAFEVLPEFDAKPPARTKTKRPAPRRRGDAARQQSAPRPSYRTYYYWFAQPQG